MRAISGISIPIVGGHTHVRFGDYVIRGVDGKFSSCTSDVFEARCVPVQAEALPRLTTEQASVLGAFTGELLGHFNDLRDYVERILGRPVRTYEMLLREVMDEIKEAARPDLMRILPHEVGE